MFLGGFYAATDGVLAALAAQLTTPETHGTGIAAAQTVVAMTRFLSAVGFGFLWFAIGRETSMFIVAGLLLVAIPLVALLLRPFLSARGQEDDFVTQRTRWIIVAIVCCDRPRRHRAIGVVALVQYQARQSAPSGAETTAPTDWAKGDRIVFRNTATGQGYGLSRAFRWMTLAAPAQSPAPRATGSTRRRRVRVPADRARDRADLHGTRLRQQPEERCSGRSPASRVARASRRRLAHRRRPRS